MIVGTRGPGAEGGIESHVDELVPILCREGWQVEVLGRSPYRNEFAQDVPGARTTWIWAPKVSWAETIFHSFMGLIYAAFRRPDVLHVHAVGPALIVPFARLLGLRVVVTHHGYDYEREKWGRMARAIIKTGERFGMRYANECIVISKDIQCRMMKEYDRKTHLIPNGVRLPRLTEEVATLQELGLEPRRYVLQVSRCVPEKRQLDLIEAFNQANLPGWKLVLVGGIPPQSEYGAALREAAAVNPDIVLAGFRKGRPLNELFTHAGLFVLPSSHEGLPIVLLEALSFGLPAVVSDIPSNLEVELPQQQYFPLGDIGTLSVRLEDFTAQPISASQIDSRRSFVKERYDWNDIAERTELVYAEALGEFLAAA